MIHQRFPKSNISKFMYCAKGDYPHVQYAFCLHALDARRAVKCGMASVTWCDVTANHRRSAHSIPHFTFRMPQFHILPIANRLYTRFSRLSNRFDNRFDNRLYRVNGALVL